MDYKIVDDHFIFNPFKTITRFNFCPHLKLRRKLGLRTKYLSNKRVTGGGGGSSGGVVRQFCGQH